MPSATTCNSKNGGQGCDRPVLAKGLCQSHYMKEIRGRDPHGPIREYGQGLRGITLRLAQETLERYDREADRLGLSSYLLRRTVLETWLDSPKFRSAPLAEVPLYDSRKFESTVRLSTNRYKALVEAARAGGHRSIHQLARRIIQTWIGLPRRARVLNEVTPAAVFAEGPADPN